jgi:GWxTD domain-containing protein
MSLTRSLTLLLVIALSGFTLAAGQPDMPQIQLPDVPRFSCDALNFSTDEAGTGRLDLYIEVSFEGLHFIKEGEVFRASYDAVVSIYDKTEKLVDEKTWTETIESKNYDETISPKAGNLTQKTFILPPNDYAISIQIQDDDTKKLTRLRREVTVRDFASTPFGISSIMLVNRIGKEGTKKVLYPNISGNVGEYRELFYLFFELYNKAGADSAMVLSTIKNVRGDVLQHDSLVEPLAEGKNSSFVQMNSSKLLTGEYDIEVRAFPLGPRVKDELKAHPATSSRLLVIRWRNLPASIAELDQAIDQMQYLTDKDKIDDMKNSAPDVKRQKFVEFWKKRDPTPNTDRNELMEEYYSRIAYANKNFSHYLDGWKTDMGMVYVIFGPPSNIERHPFDIDSKPYEV